MKSIRKAIFLTGIVQGVGMRPHIYKLAIANNLRGFVYNSTDGVHLEIEGKTNQIDVFLQELKTKLPPLARIDSMACEPIDTIDDSDFIILKSPEEGVKTTLISADTKTCHECLEDIKTKGRYHNYFAINCTNCGPRYTIIKTLPYDRENTAMQPFRMCSACQEEYDNPTNRRYHAQPTSCNLCGLELSLYGMSKKIKTKNIYAEIAKEIKNGKIIAIKSIGGFHLVCDATNDAVVQRLRKEKNRPKKPFALMCKDMAQIQEFAEYSDMEEKIIKSRENPIVVIKKKPHAMMFIAPDINKIGVMLSPSALHHLLFDYLCVPIVATSANLADEPLIMCKEEILKKLPFVDFIVDHNREIKNAIDDSLVQVVDGALQMLRLGRGYTPTVFKLKKKTTEKILALGAHTKNSIAFASGDSLILSGHIGDLGSLESFEFFLKTKESFERFYDFKPTLLLHDNHPNYQTTKWAKEQSLPSMGIGHHKAHIYATKIEHAIQERCVSFSFDGSGYGDDGTLWGGEIFVAEERKYFFKPLKLLGGEKAIQEPRRIALSLALEKFSLDEIRKYPFPFLKTFTERELQTLAMSYTKNLNAPITSSVGRLFDAVASLANLVQVLSYEGESGLLCEAHYDENIKNNLDFTIKNGVIEIDFISHICQDDFKAEQLPTFFINTLVEIMITITCQENLPIILCGGVFQNKTLVELIAKRYQEKNIRWYIQRKTPTNDGGIALGQIAYYLSSSS